MQAVGRDTEMLAEIKETKALVHLLCSEQADLETNVKDLSARADGQTVEVEGIAYPLLSLVQSFVKSNNIADHVLKFVDSISLMEMATSMSKSFLENVETQFRGNRVNLERPADQKALFSFQLEVPMALGGQPKQAAAEPRKLGMFKTYSSFHGTGSMDSGGINALKKVLEYRVPGLMREIRQSAAMTLDAKNLALALMSDARNFLESLLTFMDRQVQAYGADTKLSEARQWDLVQNIVRIIFNVITKPQRSCGEIPVSEALTPEHAPELLWATLQANKAQKDFMRYDFRNHPEVGPMLTRFLLDVVCFQDELKGVATNAQQALQEAQQCKCKVDSLESQYKNLQSRLPSKKGKKAEESKEE